MTIATRYQIICGKRGFPLTTWKDNLAEAAKIAKTFRASGYDVSIWEHDEKGARKIVY